MVIDIHTHMINGKHLGALQSVGGPLVNEPLERMKRWNPTHPQTMDVTSRVAQLDRFNIDYQLATPLPPIDPNRMALDPETTLKVCRAINDNMATITDESKGRVLCAGSVPLESLENGGLKEMERAVRGLGLKGFGIETNVKGKPLSAPQFRPFWAHAAELDVPIFMHPFDPITKVGRPYEADYDMIHVFGWPFETTLAMSHLVFSGIVEQFRNLKIVTHHLGGGVPFFWGRIEESYPLAFEKRTGVAMKKPLKEFFSRFYYDTAIGGSASAIRCAYEVFGSSQIVFATDAPFGPDTGDERLQLYPEIIRGLGLPEKDTANILGGNARRILAI